ncbi:MAG TPA: acetyl-CoA carboxylase biotin carboxyl carrier protein subunit [Acidobacteriaceae bacterium]|nr:acetyl-CoA carboxylase biotin carboxyl carrier protein subunit [Acidobacteriaceae bacterium]
MNGRTRRIELPADLSGPVHCSIDGELKQIDVHLLEPGVLSLVINGHAYRCILDEGPAGRAVLLDGKRFVYALDDPRSLRSRRGAAADAGGPRPIKAPMPGRVVRILASAGDVVEAQQGILVIEAMKMQNEMKSPKTGRVVRIAVAVGDTVQAGQVLAVID